MLRIRDVYPWSRIRLFSIPDPGFTSKNLSILPENLFFKLLEIWSWLFVQNPDPVPDPAYKFWCGSGCGSGFSKRRRIPDPQHCTQHCLSVLSLFIYLSGENTHLAWSVRPCAKWCSILWRKWSSCPLTSSPRCCTSAGWPPAWLTASFRSITCPYIERKKMQNILHLNYLRPNFSLLEIMSCLWLQLSLRLSRIE